MCGIIAGIYENIFLVLLSGLVQLQNRGYDSAGISLFNSITKKFEIYKKASIDNKTALKYLDSLKEEIIVKINNETINNFIGIGHTRWATHGAKTDKNAHPHISNNGEFSLVHNGIIENFRELKAMLIQEGYVMRSETDSEIVVNLIEFNYKKSNNVKDAIKNTVNMLKGTWGLVIATIHHPNTLFCTRFGSPLLVGYSENSALIVSEQSGFCGRVQNYFVLNNNDLCVIERTIDDSVKIETDKKYNNYKLQQNESDLSCAPYPHWMLKEIYEQRESLPRVIKSGSRLLEHGVRLGGFIDYADRLKSMKHIILLGCGTSLNAAHFAKGFFKELADFDSVQVIDGADFNIYDIPHSAPRQTCLVLCSQSGETKDLHRCIKMVKESTYDIFTIGVVNVVNSLISREVDCGCYLHAGREVGVASTKSFTSQCVLLTLVALWFSYAQKPDVHDQKRMKILNDIRQLEHDVSSILKNNVSSSSASSPIVEKITKNIVPLFLNNSTKNNNNHNNHNSCFVLGKGRGEAIANEAALKIKEISYIHAEGYATSCLKHGPFALLEPGFPVILLWFKDTHYAKSLNAYEEIKSRHAEIIVITDDESIAENPDYKKENVILIPENDTFSHMLAVIPLQLLAYYLSVTKGLNPDMPRNLAKVVTVE